MMVLIEKKEKDLKERKINLEDFFKEKTIRRLDKKKVESFKKKENTI
jgi:hypothetical protein